jgi:hypothetical protein
MDWMRCISLCFLTDAWRLAARLCVLVSPRSNRYIACICSPTRLTAL